jgi:uncharacterized membrane protein
MEGFKKNAAFFAVGGVGYGTLEMLWRGRTHWTMIIAGGLCFVIFSKIAKKYKNKNIMFKSFLCALSVTAVEFVFGLVFNIILGMNVWDYSGLPLNLLGQICLLYTALWMILATAFLPLADVMNKKLEV